MNCEDFATVGLTTMWLGEAEPVTNELTVPAILGKKNSNTSNGNSNKKACSMPSILDEVANSSDSNSNLQEARTTRSVSQDRKKRNVYHAQRSQQDELAPLSAGDRWLLRNLIDCGLITCHNTRNVCVLYVQVRQRRWKCGAQMQLFAQRDKTGARMSCPSFRQ